MGIKDINLLLENIIIIVDSRENKNLHITNVFDKMGFKYKVRKLEFGDYSCEIESNSFTEHILKENLSLETVFSIERKNSVDELIGSIKHRERFENEFIRSSKENAHMYLYVEEKEGFENMLNGNYKSKYDRTALFASIQAFESRYSFATQFIDKRFSGFMIAKKCYYEAREYLKKMEV